MSAKVRAGVEGDFLYMGSRRYGVGEETVSEPESESVARDSFQIWSLQG